MAWLGHEGSDPEPPRAMRGQTQSHSVSRRTSSSQLISPAPGPAPGPSLDRDLRVLRPLITGARCYGNGVVCFAGFIGALQSINDLLVLEQSRSLWMS